MDQGHLQAEESVRDWTRQLILVEVTAEKHSEEQINPGSLVSHSFISGQ